LEIATSLVTGRSQILVMFERDWYWPRIVWRRVGRTDNLAVITDEHRGHGISPPEGELSDWISMDWIRTLDAT